MNRESIIKSAKDMGEYLVGIRRFLHQNAETGFDLDLTVSRVKEELRKIGVSYEECGKNGIVATVGKGNGKCILLRADMDALPVKEEADVDFKCKTGNMHACGHDMHTTMLLGAAKLLKDNESLLNGCVRFMFQPAEETLSGAKNMLENGLLRGVRPSAGIMLHVMAGLPVKTGTIIVPSGGFGAPAADYFNINVKGKGCHGSMPQDGVDALSIGAHIVVSLQEITARELGLGREAVFTIGKFSAGDTGNVIPDSAILMGTMRCYDEELREQLKKRITDISQNIATAFRGECKVEFTNGCPAFENNKTLCDFVFDSTKELLGEEYIQKTTPSQKGGGSEDFSYVSQEIPALMLIIAAGNSEEGYKFPQHHPKVQFDENVLPVGSAVYAYNAIKFLEQL